MSLDVNISEPEEFNCIELHSCLREVAKSKGIEDFVYHVDYLSGKGFNFIANVFRVLLKENSEENNDKSDISVIVKTLVNTTRQKLFHELHNREVTVYENVIPKFKSVQKDLKEEDKLELPQCLYSKTETGNEIIILEDLLIKGFQMDEKILKFEKINYNQVESVMMELAKFHGLSFACERMYPEFFGNIKNKFNDIIFQDNFLNESKLRNYFSDTFNTSLQVITDANVKKKLEKVERDLVNVLRDFMKPRKFNVLCHGDCWMNNMLFKCAENECCKICFLDFQAMRYAVPVTDIIYFMYICTDSDFRSEYFLTLQYVYYDSLEIFLHNFGINIEDCYPKEEFVKDIEEYLPYGLLIALIELRIVTTTPEDEAILKGSDLVPNVYSNIVPGETDLFKFRINDVVTESVLNGVLDRTIEKIKV